VKSRSVSAVLCACAIVAQAAYARTVVLSHGVSLSLAWISPGTFTMGSPPSESLRASDEGPQTRVTLSHGFWLGTTPVTIAQWRAVMGVDLRGQFNKVLHDDTRYDFAGVQQTVRDYMHFSPDASPDQYLRHDAADLPMYFVSWNDAMAFCQRLTARERGAGRLSLRYEYTLPTEAQWEYAARAGTTGATYAPVLDEIAWYERNSAEGRDNIPAPHPVAHKRPNSWGLYDMSGNIWQWCRDWYAAYAGGRVSDPTGPAAGGERVNRGGSFGSGARAERSANRAGNPPAEASAYRGFRLALVAR
jgi:formylglycine-generating enzyme required for sulfatase activity